MSDHKKNQISADSQKASSISQEQAVASVAETKKKVRKAPKAKKIRKKGMPIVVDILIVLSLLAVITGAVWGVYELGDHFSTRYAQREITYTLFVKDVDGAIAFDEDGKCVVLPDTDVFVIDGDKSSPVGKVLSASTEQAKDGKVDVYVVVRTTSDYNYTLGYFADGVKIAVGKAYTCRFSGLVSDAVIVELQITEGES